MYKNNNSPKPSVNVTTRRQFLGMAAGAVLLPSAAFAMGKKVSVSHKPNVVVLFIDDLGYGDTEAFGCPDIPTPNITRLAKEGTKCTNAYTICPVCSPSRTAIMMGMYPNRFGVFGNEDRGAPIPEDHPTLAEFMKDAGYVTGMVGRWDIGSVEQGPLNEGFMEVARRSMIDSSDPRRAMPKGPTYIQKDGVYWTDRQGDEMVDFVTRHKDEKFFLYFAPLAIHFPVEEAPQKYLDRVPASITDEKRRYLAGTLIAADDAVGKVMAAIKENKLDENTLVILTGDNGGWDPDGARHEPFRGGKATEWEGAVHEPFIVRWPGTVPAGKTYDGMISTLDVYATSAAVAEKPLPEKCEGVNLLPYLQGLKDGEPHETLYWRWLEGGKRSAHAVRHKNWRLMRKTEDQPWRLYDIKADPGETTDLADQKPEVVKKLSKMYEDWVAELPGPSGYSRGVGGHCPTGIGWATPDNP